MTVDQALISDIVDILSKSDIQQKELAENIKKELSAKFRKDSVAYKAALIKEFKNNGLANLLTDEDYKTIAENIAIVPDVSTVAYNGVVDAGNPDPAAYITHCFVIKDTNKLLANDNNFRLQIVYGSSSNRPSIIPELDQPACATLDDLRAAITGLPGEDKMLQAIADYEAGPTL
jgi:hypothetical protein